MNNLLQKNVAKQHFLRLPRLPQQPYFVTGNSLCASRPFDMKHQERFHRAAKQTSVWTAFKGMAACCFAYMTVTLLESRTHTFMQITVCDYKVKLKTVTGWIPPWFPFRISITCALFAGSGEFAFPKRFLLIAISCRSLDFACVVPPITAPNDYSRPHLKKRLSCTDVGLWAK